MSQGFSLDNSYFLLLDKIIDHPALTQDEKQMIQTVKKHFFENGVINRQLTKNISIITRNLQNVQILCQGDAAYEQDLTTQLNSANSILKGIQERIAPQIELIHKLDILKKEADELTENQQKKDSISHNLNNEIEKLQLILDKENIELSKLNENINFKSSVHKHLKKNLESKKQMIQRLKTSLDDQTKKLNTGSQDCMLEIQRRKQQIDRQTNHSIKLKHQLSETNKKLEEEKHLFDVKLAESREKKREAVQSRNDAYETLQKGEIEKKLLQSQLQRHIEKFKLVSKRADEAKKDLEKTYSEIEDAKKKIEEYSAIPESHINNVKQLKADNVQLLSDIEKMTIDESEAREQVQKLRDEFKELEAMDAHSRRIKMERQQKSLRDTLEKIDIAVIAAESTYTCFECLKSVKEPMTFVPCGHSCCKHHKRHTDDLLICPECKSSCDIVFAHPVIPELLSKLQFLHSLISTAIEN